MNDLVTIHTGDALSILRAMTTQSVQCCVTSPPYWGLRNYQVDGQIGLEKTPEAYVAKMVGVFAELRRVLRDDGTLWLNLGDSYAGSGMTGGTAGKDGGAARVARMFHGNRRDTVPGLAQKQLIGIPWRVAFALQADGWYLRSDIIWHKPNPMPESVTDRPTKAHEYIFLLTKSERYYYDADAIAEPATSMQIQMEQGYNGEGTKDYESSGVQNPSDVKRRIIQNALHKADGKNSRMNRSRDPAHEHEYNGKNRNDLSTAKGRRLLEHVKEARANGGDHNSPFGVTRNKRSVWTVATSPYRDAHFATYPPELIRPCVLAGTRLGDTVLDPFAGSGTTGMVALELGRKAILIELNPKYVELIRQRCAVTPGLPLA